MPTDRSQASAISFKDFEDPRRGGVGGRVIDRDVLAVSGSQSLPVRTPVKSRRGCQSRVRLELQPQGRIPDADRCPLQQLAVGSPPTRCLTLHRVRRGRDLLTRAGREQYDTPAFRLIDHSCCEDRAVRAPGKRSYFASARQQRQQLLSSVRIGDDDLVGTRTAANRFPSGLHATH